MSASVLLREFARFSSDAYAVPGLRRVVLDLAVRGRLSVRDPRDGSAAELLSAIQSKLPTSGGLNRKHSDMPSVGVAATENPFPIPDTWRWTRIREITRHHGPAKPTDVFTYIDVTSIDKEAGRIRNPAVVEARDAPARARKRVCVGDVLYSCVRPYLLNIAVVDATYHPPPIASTAFAVLDGMGVVVPRYLWTVLRSPYFVKCVEDKMRGQAYPAINDADFARLPIPLPPLAEQRRIVAKVDGLTALCDELEAAQIRCESRRDRLRMEALRALVAGDRPALEASARFFLSSSSRIVTKPEHVADVRQAILDLAVKGRLAPQQAQTDTPARTALNEADTKRAKIAHSDRRAAPQQQRLLASDLRWDVPAGWAWRGLADLVLFIDYRGRTPAKTTAGIRLVTAKNVRPGRVSPQPEEFISPEEYARWMTRGLPRSGDVLFTTEAPMGNAAVVRDDEPFALAQRVIDLRSYGAIEPDFLALQLAAAPFQAVLSATATGLTAKGIKAAKLKRLPIAVPPLEEQRRIVAKVNELMGVCEQMELSLAHVLRLRTSLLEAAVRDASRAVTEELVDAV